MFKIFILLFIVLSVILNSCDGARIFGAFPTPSISHQCVFRSLMEELARRGHEMVVLTADPQHYTQSEYVNLTEIDVHDISYSIWRSRFNFVQDRLTKPSILKIIDDYLEAMLIIAEEEMSHPKMQQLIKNPIKFDVCFVESILPFFTLLKDIFNCSLISMTSLSGVPSNFEMTGNPTHPIYYFDMFNPYGLNDLNFLQRLQLLIQRLEFHYLWDWKYHSVYRKLSEKIFGPNVREIKDVESEVDMIFQTFDPIVNGIRPLVPAVVHIGSIHIKPPNPLPTDIQKILDDAVNGAIYLSFGSNVRSVDIPDERLNQIFNALKSLPHTVLWKWETENLLNKPKNVIVSQWFPQQSILAHPNVKLFITQGGQQSLDEAIHHAVPMIGVPFFSDQASNVANIVRQSIGRRLFIESITTEDLKETIIDIITNSSYHDNIVKLRKLIYDQPQTPMERAVWWTEYVIRHKGAKHLRSPTAGMSSWEYYLVWDLAIVFAFCVAVIILVIRSVKYILKMFTATQKLKKH